jgi:hypothetical protein
MALSVLLTPAYLRAYLVVLLIGYVAFILAAWRFDRSIGLFCRQTGIPKTQRFIFGSYVDRKAFKAFLDRLKTSPTPPAGFLTWLSFWAFMSQVFLGLSLIFVALSVTGLVEHSF